MTSQRDVFLFVALAVAWGTAFGAVEVGLETLPPILFAALRLDGATLLFVAAVAAIGSEWRPRTRADLVTIAVSGGLIVGGHYGLMFLGQTYVSSGVAAIVLSLTPIVTPPLALALLPRERIRAPAVVGLGLGLAGVVAIALSGGSLGGQVAGVGLLLGSSLVFAIGSVLTERTHSTLSLLPLQTWAMGVGAVMLHALSFARPTESAAGLRAALTVETTAALAYLAVVSTAGGFLAYFVLLERVGASELSLVNYASPVVAALVGWALLGETITPATIGGFALILAGFALCKIDALWRLGAPVVGYGPTRPAAAAARADDVVVDGNVYVANADRYAGSMQSAD
ncbi:DMT family transporter [Natronococcus sp. JC468]|uniref:DMT family transporter n=1 Tax=Natronococcus sp. JC468 TaxID=1961921 RepID=UPI00143C74DD|nr:DMT family transporter [Natronococcus sp. JC468]NKE34589.1 DMT family transporter [Natronococcus sp. JC468]